MPAPRIRPAAATGADGRIYVLGGEEQGGNRSTFPVKTVEVYDPRTDTWRRVRDMINVRESLAAATGSDGRLYAIGGTDGSGQDLDSVEAYDPASGTWSAVASMPTRRRHLAAVAGPDGRIYALGGTVGHDSYFNTVEAYSPDTNTWTTITPMLTGRHSTAAALGGDGRIYAVGGDRTTDGSGVVDTVEALTILAPMAPTDTRPHTAARSP